MAKQNTQNDEIVFIRLEHHLPVDYNLEDLRDTNRAKRKVFDTSVEPPRPVLVTYTGMWVESEYCTPDNQAYDKFIIHAYDDGQNRILGVSSGEPRSNAERTGVAQDLDELQERVIDYTPERD